MAARRKTPDFEAGLNQLEAIVTALEGGTLSLDEALQAFELGAGIARQCQQTLRAAEQRVQLVLTADSGAADGGETITEDFADGEADSR